MILTASDTFVNPDVMEPLSGEFRHLFPALRLSSVTLNQLKVFVLVVRLGSFRAAANALGVSEPAVSQAITALRQSLGDQLIVRGNPGLELTDAGQRIVGLASQMVNLAVETEAAVRQARGGPALLRVAATATPGDAVVPALLQAFTSRTTGVEATLGVAAHDELAALVSERLTDVAIGPRLASSAFPGLISEPLLKYRLVLVANPQHRLAQSATSVPQRVLAEQDWYVDPSGTDPRSDVGQLLARLNVAERNVSVFPNERAAWAAVAGGGGIAPAVEHLLLAQRPANIALLRIEGMPMELMWHVNMLDSDRRSPMSSRLHRFLSTPDAMQAMFRADGRVPASKFKPPIYVTIWS
jgi:LysR family transcriptional regulator, low CO2-responsive transcriptional regulator